VSINQPQVMPSASPSYNAATQNKVQLNPDMAASMPSVYAAAMSSNMNNQQVQMMNQIHGTISTYKALSALPIEEAKKNYKVLGSEAQAMIKSMYGNAPFTNTDNMVMKVAKFLGSAALSTVKTPIVALYRAAGTENQIINAPYLFARELTQGESPFHLSTYSKAWDGRAIYDQGTLANLKKTYGDAASFVAQGLIKGMKPGEIVDAYGKVDSGIYTALADMYSNNKKFNDMMNEFRGAQVSPGRDIARVMYHVPTTDSHFYTTEKWKIRTGTIDAFYELAHDPLTYFGGEIFKGLGAAGKGVEAMNKGTRAAEALINPATRAKVAEDLYKPGTTTFNNAEYRFGPLIKEYAAADAAKNTDAKAAVMRKIKTDAPEIDDRNFLKLASEAKAFDANGWKEWVKTMEGVQEMHMGMVDGPTALRMGIPIAKLQRNLAGGFNRVTSEFFNGGLVNEEIDAIGGGEKVFNALKGIGKATDPLTGKPGTVISPLLDDLTAQMNIRRRIARQVQTYPGRVKFGVTDDLAEETVPVVKQYLRLAGIPRYAADKTAEAYKFANPVDRTLFLRGMFDHMMTKMGVDENIKRAVLEAKFGDSTTFLNSRDLRIDPAHLDYWIPTDTLVHSPIEGNDALYSITANGPIHSFQGKPFITGLDFSGKELFPYGFNFSKEGTPAHTLNWLIGRSNHSAWLRKVTSMWATGSVVPRIGGRGSIEQGIFHYLTAPWENLTGWFKGQRLNELGIGISGDMSHVPYGARLRMKIFGKSLKDWIPTKSVYQQIDGQDMKIIQGRLDKGLVSGQEVWTAAQPHDIIHAVANKISKYAGGDAELAQIFEVFLKHPSASAAAEVNSVLARSAAHQGYLGGELDQKLVSDEGLVRLAKENNYVFTGDWGDVDPKEAAAGINGIPLAHSHYRVWAPMFQNFNVLDGFHFGENFIRHNALRTGKDFAMARDAILRHFGVDPITREIVDEAKLDKYLNFSMQTGRDLEEKGWNKVTSAIHRIQIGLQDMRTTFHGDPIKFNDRLYDAIRYAATDLKGKPIEWLAPKVKDVTLSTPVYSDSFAIRKALDMIQYDNFEELTRLHHPTGVFKSDIAMAEKGFLDVARSSDEWIPYLQKTMQNFGEGGVQGKALHYMDTQINWLFNQPAFAITKVNLYKKYLPMQQELLRNLIKGGMDKTLARNLAERHFVELSEKNAAQIVTKFVDNSVKQSVLSNTMRTAGRFYRAQEQFQRRIMRLKDYPLRSLYRMRLLHLGVDNMGFLHNNANGEPTFTIPGDNVIFHALNGGINFALHREANVVSNPMFADFNMNLLQSSPSLGPEAGAPSFSGPLASVSVLTLKSIFNHLPWGIGKEAATGIDKYLLGRGNLTPSKILPVAVQRALDAMPKDLQDNQLASAGAMAILYNAAHGFGAVTPLSTHSMTGPEYVTASRKYIDNIKITANNVLFMRAMLGMFSPISPTMQERDAGVSNYLKDVGITGFSPAFNDILQGVMRNDKGISDPYEIALGIFTRDYPGRAIYGVSKNVKETRLLQSYTKDMVGWTATNQKWVGPDAAPGTRAAAFIFAPHIGAYDPNTYLYLESQGLIKQKPLQTYLNDIMTAQDYAAYENAKYREQQAMITPGVNRNKAIKDAQAEQQAILAGNPELSIVMGDAKQQLSRYQDVFNSLGSILGDKSFPMTDGERKKMTSAWTLVNSALTAMTANNSANGFINSASTKAASKEAVLNGVAEIGGAASPGEIPRDPQIAEALKSVFEPLLNNLSRTTVKVGLTR